MKKTIKIEIEIIKMNSNISQIINSMRTQIQGGLRKSFNTLHALAKKCKKEIEIQKIKYTNKIGNISCNCHLYKSCNLTTTPNIKSKSSKKRKKTKDKETTQTANGNKSNQINQNKCIKLESKSSNQLQKPSLDKIHNQQPKYHNTSKNETSKTENHQQKQLEKRKKKKKSRNKRQQNENVDDKDEQNNLESTRYLPEIEEEIEIQVKDTNKLNLSTSFYDEVQSNIHTTESVSVTANQSPHVISSNSKTFLDNIANRQDILEKNIAKTVLMVEDIVNAIQVEDPDHNVTKSLKIYMKNLFDDSFEEIIYRTHQEISAAIIGFENIK